MVRAVGATGTVITSAGVVLAAVFAALGVLPLVTLGQLGLIVGLGVLLDTVVVRTLVVPALAGLVGDRLWWPAPPANRVK
jgi:RND superfamily putative drug exporter